jgi:ubiquinone/menaquinone biosynthesis C-methylase UbiE
MVTYDGGKLPFEDNSFDATLAVFVLHHCMDTTASLKELIRVAKKKIIIIEEIYNNEFEKFLLFSHDWIGNHLESWDVNIPLNFMPLKKWEKVFKENNLIIEDTIKVYQFPLFNLTNQVYFELSKK